MNNFPPIPLTDEDYERFEEQIFSLADCANCKAWPGPQPQYGSTTWTFHPTTQRPDGASQLTELKPLYFIHFASWAARIAYGLLVVSE